MFLQYFGFREQPFGTTPDPRFLYMSDSHREAFASLVYGIETGRGFVALIARPGMGKTTLLFQLMERLKSSARTAFLFQTQGNSCEFFSSLIADLGLDPANQNLSELQRQLNDVLIQEAQLGRRVVLVIDEAQTLDDSVLESVRMLSNFETPRAKLMQIVLAGQPQLADKLAQADLVQLRQRVSIVSHLEPFTPSDTQKYVDHRLKTAGYSGKPLFTPEALAVITERSEGIPRNINNLCFHALSLAFAKGEKRVDPQVINEVLSDLNLELLGSRPATFERRSEQAASPSIRTDADPVASKADRPSKSDSAPGAAGKHAGALSSFPIPGAAFSFGSTPNPATAAAPASTEEKPSDAAASRPSLDDVTLKRSRFSEGHGAIYGGSKSKRTGSNGKHQRMDVTHWLLWTVALLALILLGEALLDSLPLKSQIGQSLSEVVHKARVVIGNEGQPAKVSGPKQPVSSSPPAASESTSAESSMSRPLVQVMPAEDDLSSAKDPSSAQAATALAANVTPPDPVSISADSETAPAVRKTADSADDLSPAGDEAAVADGGKLVIESNVSGGKVTINGQSSGEWITPHIFSLPAGAYQISVSKGGYATWSRNVEVEKGRKKWVLARLGLPRGVIVIDTDPPGLQVFIDGKDYGPSEVQTALSVGSHTFKVVPPGKQRPFVGTFKLKPGDILTRKVRWVTRGSMYEGAKSQTEGENQLPRATGRRKS